MKKQIGEKLRTLRLATKLNQNELAEILKVTQASLSAYETGNKLPSLEVLCRISEYFSVSLDWLCNNTKASLLKRNTLYADDAIIQLKRMGLLDKTTVEVKQEGTGKEISITIKEFVPDDVEARFHSLVYQLQDFIFVDRNIQKTLSTIENDEDRKKLYDSWFKENIKLYARKGKMEE